MVKGWSWLQSGLSAVFKTIQTPSGTSPVATGPNDVLTFTSSDSSIGITGNAATDTVDFTLSGGGSFGAIVNINNYASPTTISGAVTVTGSNQRTRIFLKGNASLVSITSITSGSGTKELYIVGCDAANKVQLGNLSNVQVSGLWTATAGSEITLHWIDGLSKWLEAGRNEI